MLSDNILACYHSAPPTVKDIGLSWYPRAHDFAASLGDVSIAAGVIAALSPLQSWRANKATAAKAMRQGNANGCGLLKSCANADMILSGVPPLEVLTGNKTRNFYMCILDPTGSAVCIDRHAFDIAVGMRTNDRTRKLLQRKGVYSDFAHAYQDAAAAEGVIPNQMQAITWEYWRFRHNRRYRASF